MKNIDVYLCPYLHLGLCLHRPKREQISLWSVRTLTMGWLVRFVFTSFILIAVLVPNLQAQTDEARNDQAFKLMEDEHYKEALIILSPLVEANPENTTYRYNRAICLFNVKKYKEAIVDYKNLAAFDSDESEYAFQIGNAYDQMDSLKQAIRYYTTAIQIDGDQFLYYFKRGTVYLKLNEWQLSIQDFNQSLAIDPEHHNSLHNRGIAYYKIGKQTKGCEDWCSASRLGNPSSASHLERNCKNNPTLCQLKK